MKSLFRGLLWPVEPLLETARGYSFAKLRRDAVAGLTVSVVELPQAMAYALVAGVPPEYGIYTSIIQGSISAMLSSSEHITSGPTNTQSLLVASAISRLTNNPAIYLKLVFALTMLKGIIQLAFAAARMGRLVRYVSRSVIVGVAGGAGVLIIAGQIPNLLGIDPGAGRSALPGVAGMLARSLPQIHGTNMLALWVGLGCLGLMAALRVLSPLLPGSLLAVACSAALVAGAGWEARVPVIGSLPRAFPAPQLPQATWGEIESLLGGALALAVLGMLESVAIARSIAARSGDRIEANREFFAQGVSNLASSFFQCMPGSGSFTRSALDYSAGAASRFAAVFNALFVGSMFWVLAGQARFIPYASLAAVLLTIAVGLIDWRYIWKTFRVDRGEAAVCLATFAATVFAPLEYAIFIGIFMSIATYLHKAGHLHLAEMYFAPGGKFLERPLADRSGGRPVMFLQLEGDLFFAVADELEDHLMALAGGDARVVILRLKRTHSIDVTVLEVLERFVRLMRRRGRHVILCGLRDETRRLLARAGLEALVGRENMFLTGTGIFDSAKRAVRRARDLLGASIDAEGIPADDEEPEEPTYEI